VVDTSTASHQAGPHLISNCTLNGRVNVREEDGWLEIYLYSTVPPVSRAGDDAMTVETDRVRLLNGPFSADVDLTKLVTEHSQPTLSCEPLLEDDTPISSRPQRDNPISALDMQPG
jgi:hypothetical protein